MEFERRGFRAIHPMKVYRIVMEHWQRWMSSPVVDVFIESIEVVVEAKSGAEAVMGAKRVLGDEWTVRCVNIAK